MWHWRDILNGAMRLQSQNALGQAGLLIGPEHLVRMDLPKEIPLDDWRSAVSCLPATAAAAVEASGDRVAAIFLGRPVQPYISRVLAE
jgi:hypothetical protein